MPKTVTVPNEPRVNAYDVTIMILTLMVPALVLPWILDNAFNVPKTTLMALGAFFMAALYGTRFLRGKLTPYPLSSAHKIMAFIILLNLFSFFYTQNFYYTIRAAMMNIVCLLIFYFVSLNVTGKRAFLILATAAFSGLFVSLITWLQFFNIFILFKWAHANIMVMGTIGNSNYLGAYLVFPLFATFGLIFLLRGKMRLVPIIVFIFMLAAFLFTRARAGWFGFFLALPVFLLILKKIHGFSAMNYLKANSTRVLTSGIVLLAVLISLWFFAPQRFHSMMSFRQLTHSKTLKLRMEKYYRASFWLFKQNPVFGTGLWSFRNLVYEAQAEINKVDENYFKNYPEPKPRRVHTDYLEVLNDGGLLAAAALLLFLILVMRHGWRVIENREIPERDRIITGTAFCSVIAIMLAAFFFFPFRINSTMFMTVLMMGIIEGIFLRHYNLISTLKEWRSDTRIVLIPLFLISLIGMVWFTNVKTFLSEMEHFEYKRALANNRGKEAEKHILKAIDYDPHNSAYCLYASQLYMNVIPDFGKSRDFLERAIIDYNGDVTRWSIYFMKGLLNFNAGSLFEARSAYLKALYYNPTFELASERLVEVKNVIKDHDKVLIKFR